MWATMWTGYSFAAIGRNFLLYDPDLIWPSALMQTALFRTLRGEGQSLDISRKQIRVFWLVLVGVFFWTFLPEYAFPFTSSLAVICWFAPRNDTVKFISSGIGGMGFMNFTLNWYVKGLVVMVRSFFSLELERSDLCTRWSYHLGQISLQLSWSRLGGHRSSPSPPLLSLSGFWSQSSILLEFGTDSGSL